MFIETEEIINLTTHHPPANERVAKAHEEVRGMVQWLMLNLNDVLPDCPQKTHLIRQVLPLQVMSAANQIIAIHGINEGGTGAADQLQPEGDRARTD